MSEGNPVARHPLGPESLKAFTHPLRMALYTHLQRQGPATASSLARTLSESSGQTSYHLRQLERHGFVEDDPDHTGGRERWWRAVGFDMQSADLLRDPDTAGSVKAMLLQMVGERTTVLSAWAQGIDPEDPAPGLLITSTAVMSPAELLAFGQALQELIDAHLDAVRHRPEAEQPPGARRVRVHADLLPLPAQESATTASTAAP